MTKDDAYNGTYVHNLKTQEERPWLQKSCFYPLTDELIDQLVSMNNLLKSLMNTCNYSTG